MDVTSLGAKFNKRVQPWLFTGTVCLVTVAGYLVMSSHATLEQNRIARIQRQVSRGSSEVISELQSKIGDWGQWDELYGYLTKSEDGWAADNITADNLASIGVDAIAFFDETVTCRFGLMMQEQAPMELKGGGEIFCSQIVPYITASGKNATINNRIVLLPGREALVAVIAPVVHTDGSGPVVGYVVGATYISDDLQSEIGGNEFVVSILRRDRTEQSTEFSEAERSLSGPSMGVRNLSPSMNVLYARFGNDSSSGGLIMRLEVPRDENQAGRRDVIIMLVIILVLHVLMKYIGSTSVRRFVLKPVRELAVAVDNVSKGSGRASDIKSEGHDELAALAQAVRAMVMHLEESRHEAEGLAYDLQKFRLAVENATDMIVIADAEFNVVFASRSSAGISGYEERELVGKGALLLWSYQDEKLREVIRQELAAGRPWHGEAQCRRKNGDRYVAELNIAPVMDKQGQLVFSVSIQRDITQAKEVDRMKTEFVSIASHQLKTPLTGIKWFTETLMQDDSTFTGEQKEFLHQLYEMNERMIRLVNDLLNVSRIESSRKFSVVKTLTDLVAVVRHAEAEQGVIAGKRGITIKTTFSGETVLLLMDEEKIRQVVHNLLNNAVKYSHDGGEVRLSVSENAAEVVVSVSDDGIGIPEGQKKRIFEKFFRAENVGPKEGTGLGLYIVKAIVEGHGGRVSFTSNEKSGTTFMFTLPRQENLPPAA